MPLPLPMPTPTPLTFRVGLAFFVAVVLPHSMRLTDGGVGVNDPFVGPLVEYWDKKDKNYVIINIDADAAHDSTNLAKGQEMFNRCVQGKTCNG